MKIRKIKHLNGEWIDLNDPKAPDGIGGREYFAEKNALTYTWPLLQS